MTDERIADLLDAFSAIPDDAPAKPTYLEATGYAYYEAVVSNLLAFFLDPNNAHGLDHLFLDALLAASNVDCERVSIQSIETEVSTDNQNRIDILVHSDTHVIGIENKIYAAARNPFDDYARHVESLAGQREHILIYLAFNDVPAVATEHGFIGITYETLLAEVRARLGAYAVQAPTDQLVFALDFIKSLDNIRKGGSMNQAVLELIAGRERDVVTLLQHVKDLQSDLRRKIDQLELQAEITGVRHDVSPWRTRNRDELFDCLVHDVTFPNGAVVAVDAHVRASGWHITIFRRDQHVTDVKALIEWLNSIGVPIDPGLNLELAAAERVRSAEFDYAESPKRVAEHLQQLVRTIANAPTEPA